MEAWIETCLLQRLNRAPGVASRVEAWIETDVYDPPSRELGRLPRGGVD